MRPILRSPLLPAIFLLALVGAGCSYARLLRPSVLKQLNPRMVALVNELPHLDNPNEDILARVFATGGLSHARLGSDGVMRDRLTIRMDQLIYEPSIVVMPRAGALELEVTNGDESAHLLFAPSNGTRQTLVLPHRTAGRIRIHLDQPGLYTFACPVSNHAGRGELGVIIVKGETPAEARLDRPPQRRPGH
jgi:PQQ system protein